MECRFEDGRADSVVLLVRSVVRAGNEDGMGVRDWRCRRRVEVKSRLLKLAKRGGWVDEEVRSLSGFPRRDRVDRLGRMLRLAMSSSDVIVLEERLSVVRSSRFRGLVIVVKLLDERDSDFRDGNDEVRDTMSVQVRRVLSSATSSIRWKGLVSSIESG